VPDSTAHGFTVVRVAHLSAPPETVYRRIVRDIGRWWDPRHTWSGDAHNLSVDDRPGGCFCERLPEGGVQHLTVVLAAPARMLRLRGALGPLQGMAVEGSLTFALAPDQGGTGLRLTYAVGGYGPEGLQGLASAVDTVLGLQLDRLERFVETGRPTR
jgi:uncharacterized protein YndB with AHSA1/START domain